MSTSFLKAAPLFLLLPISPMSSTAAAGQPQDDQDIVINGERLVTLDDDDPIVWHVGRRGGAYLGVHLLDIPPALREHFGAPRDAGVLVSEVESGTPAAKAGLQVGDVITRVEGDKVESSGDVSRPVRRKKAGETVKIEVVRNKTARSLTATIESRPRNEIDLGDLRHHIREGTRGLRDFRFEMPRIGRLEDFETMQKKLDDLDKRLKDLEKKVPAR